MEKVKFTELGLGEEVLRAIEDMGFENPSDIQRDAIPVLMEGHDLIGQAQTGTGKTLAFGAPILSGMEKTRGQIKAIMLTPTRELAIQVSEELKRISKYKGIKTTAVYGGSSIQDQIRAIKSNTDIVVGTPGRVLDLIRRRVIRLENIEYLVLDEADEMLNMGFLDDIEEIVRNCNEDRQTLLFSATMPDRIKALARNYMKPDLKHVKIAKKSITTASVEQFYFETKARNRFETLCRILDFYAPTSSIIFCNTKKEVDEIVANLQKKGYSVEGMHGDMTQGFRMRTLENFREGTIKVLVATDVAARGIDVSHVTHVINYGLPFETDSYVHRIGRTGRANREGTAYTIVTSKDKPKLKQIQRVLKCVIDRKDIPKIEEIFKAKSELVIKTIREELDKKEYEGFIEMAKELTETDSALDIIAVLLSMKYKEETSYEMDDDSIEGTDYMKSEEARIFINIGKKDGITKRKLISFLVDEGHMKENAIKNITILDKFSFFNLKSKDVERLFKRCQGRKFCKRAVNMEIAKGK
ncbi:DEAD-box ATP-dependent RNA helicase CshA [Andreesenia angusta]|uniref:DEAD-box ATP-dependent RNA helicase CshA n=1 Tax=Andreesenia angusta TaxID=39480 RepID=A0A1S1V8L8_9FIRM|nr:DEAD/DEAH box helicase [Andreesenia angusta]OHW62740.1 DEAD-box ATP-dependent RNA helicase CshA [Andreesenia angusta]